jgi:hypothetical protein
MELVAVEFCLPASMQHTVGAAKAASVQSPAISHQPPVVAKTPSQANQRTVTSKQESVVSIQTPVNKELQSSETQPLKRTVEGKQINIEIMEMKRQWPEFLRFVQNRNPSLVLILKTAEPMRINGAVLCLGYKYSFHKARLDSNPAILENLLSEFFKETIIITSETLAADYSSEFIKSVGQQDEVELLADAFVAETVSAQTIDSNISQDEMIANLVRAFGGKVVE